MDWIATEYPPGSGRWEYRLGEGTGDMRDRRMMVEVRRSFGSRDGTFDIHVVGPGNFTIQEISTVEHAKEVGEYLYEHLLPEHELREARRKAEYAEMEAKREAERPAQIAAAKKLAKRIEKAPRIEALKCPSCGDLFRKGDEGEPIYECSRCGGQSTERRCEQSGCGVFGRKVGDRSCPHCEAPLSGPEGEEPETAEAVLLDGKLYAPEES